MFVGDCCMVATLSPHIKMVISFYSQNSCDCVCIVVCPISFCVCHRMNQCLVQSPILHPVTAGVGSAPLFQPQRCKIRYKKG